MSKPIENERTNREPPLNRARGVSLVRQKIVVVFATALVLSVIVFIFCAVNAFVVKADATRHQHQFESSIGTASTESVRPVPVAVNTALPSEAVGSTWEVNTEFETISTTSKDSIMTDGDQITLAKPSALEVGGIVSGVWGLAGSPYVIITDTIVPASSVLTIESGVEIRFDGHYKFIVNGTLIAQGTATDTILFTRNQPTDESRGWGIRFENTSGDTSVLSFCTIEYGYARDGVWGSIAHDRGGGIYCSNCNLIVENCHIRNNIADVGGGIYASLYSEDSLVIRNNLIEDNQAIDFGYSASGGGGIKISGDESSFIRVENNIIVGNSYTGNDRNSEGGGGINLSSSYAAVVNNTIVGNSSPKGSGILIVGEYPRLIANNIVWGNTGSDNDEQIAIQTGYMPGPIPEDLAIHHNDIQDAAIVVVYRDTLQGIEYTAGIGNIDADPLFVDPANGDFHLASGSPCIDAGMGGEAPTDDMDGEPRPTYYSDIGADEFPYAVQLTPGYQREMTNPGAVVSYTHTVYNSGTLTETFELTVTSSLTQAIQPLSVTLGSGASVSVTLALTVPAGAAIGDVDTAVITATSSSSPTVAWARAEDVTLVGVGVELGLDGSGMADPGQTITLTHTLTNTGNAQDTYTLTTNSSLGWATLLTSNVITVSSGATETIQVQATLPPTAAVGLVETTIVTATSWTAAQAYDTAQDTTTANPTSGDRYVTTEGDNTANNCLAQAHPCHSVGWATQQAQSGDTVKVATGTYNDTYGNSTGTMASIDRELTLTGGYTTTNWSVSDPSSYPTVLDAYGLEDGLYLEGDGITITLSGLTIQRGYDSNVYVHNARLVMTNCIVDDNTNYFDGKGLYLYHSDYSQVIGSRITGARSEGVYLVSSDYAIFEDNTITNNGSYGVYSRHSYNLTLDSNTITGNADDGLYLYAYGGHRLDNNIIGENNGDGLVLVGWVSWSPVDAVLRHNTIVSNAGGEGVRVGVYSTVLMTNTIVANHTYGILTADPSASVTADHTLWYANTTNTDSSAGGTINTTNDLSGDPSFAGGSDLFAAYHIQAGSAAIDAGADAGLTTDIDGQARAPDIGADEFPYAVQLTPDYQQEITAPGALVSYTHDLRNSGALAETFELTVTSDLTWSVQPLSATLDSGASLTVTLTLSVPVGTAIGYVDTAVITAASSTSPTVVWARAQDVTSVGAGVELEPDDGRVAEPGQVVAYTHTLTNTGSAQDTYTLTLSSSQGWATLLTSNAITVSSGATEIVQVQVSLPPTAAAGLTEVTVVTATSWTVSEVYDTVQDTTIVRIAPGLLLAPDRSMVVAPDTVIAYTHTLTNTGNGPDIFAITHHSDQGWTVEHDVSIALGQGQTATVIVSVTVPTGSDGLTDVTIVTATSQTKQGVYAMVTDTTIVTGVCIPVQSVGISGPSTAVSGTAITLNAVYTPTDATGVTMLWDNNTTGSTADYTWVEEGEQTVVVTATAACGDPVTSIYTVAVTATEPHRIYLPVVLRNR